MLIGILSDSHGHASRTAEAVRILLEAGAEILLHLGDIETTAVLDELVGHNAHIVFGNCDWDHRSLATYAEHVGIAVEHPRGHLVIADKTVVFTHGDRDEIMSQTLNEGVHYLLHGHTHQVRDEKVGTTRIINPGALFRASQYTVAVLDPESDDLRFLEIPHHSPVYGSP